MLAVSESSETMDPSASHLPLRMDEGVTTISLAAKRMSCKQSKTTKCPNLMGNPFYSATDVPQPDGEPLLLRNKSEADRIYLHITSLQFQRFACC